MLNLKVEGSQDQNMNNRFELQKQNSHRKFVLSSNLNEISKKYNQQEKKMVLPYIQNTYFKTEQSNELTPSVQLYKKQIECIKLPEIDEKFFINNTFKKDFMNKPKVYSHSHQVSREECEFTDSEKNNYLQVTKKVDFQDDVLIYDYINHTYKKDRINGSSKSVKLRRQQTKKLSDDLTKSYKQNLKSSNLFRMNPKSRFFEENSKESKNQAIVNTMNDDL